LLAARSRLTPFAMARTRAMSVWVSATSGQVLAGAKRMSTPRSAACLM